MNKKDRKLPRATTGIYIVNKNGEILLARSSKWNDLLVPPGGHIEYGEPIIDCVVREAKEETGLDVKNASLLTVIDMIEPENFNAYTTHFVGLQFRAEVDNHEDVVLEERELQDYEWLLPEEIVKRDDVEDLSKKIVQEYFVDSTPEKIDSLKIQLNEFKEGWKRAQADYQNLHKSVEDNRSELVRLSELQILNEFLPILDNFKKCFNSVPEDDKQWVNWKKGVEYIMKQFSDVMKAHNIEDISTVGKKFDPELHEAVGEEESEEKEGVVIREVDAGYTMKGKVIKVAKVIVSK